MWRHQSSVSSYQPEDDPGNRSWPSPASSRSASTLIRSDLSDFHSMSFSGITGLTTMSIPIACIRSRRNIFTRLLNRFRRTLPPSFLDTENPRRIRPRVFLTYTTESRSPLIRLPRLYTARNAVLPDRAFNCRAVPLTSGIDPGFRVREPAYGDRTRRPRLRRAFRIFLPDREDIRALNPCLRARERRLGWYVRFIPALPPTVLTRGRLHPSNLPLSEKRPLVSVTAEASQQAVLCQVTSSSPGPVATAAINIPAEEMASPMRKVNRCNWMHASACVENTVHNASTHLCCCGLWLPIRQGAASYGTQQ